MPAGMYDPRRGDSAVLAERVIWPGTTSERDRTNYFTVHWFEKGAGTLEIDGTLHRIAPPALAFVGPYHRVRVDPARRLEGIGVRFHANFLCVETFHAESGCSGVLFNDPFGSPIVPIPPPARAQVRAVVAAIGRELSTRQLGYEEVVTANLKILLVVATRLKGAARPPASRTDHRHPLVARLTQAIEGHYRTRHAPAEYAALLNMTPKALARFARAQFGKTMTELVRERLLIDAKWDLLHTLKPVKEIAGALGFADELYFSRLFKKATGRSPSDFREFETAIRGGSNLSMSLSGPPIPPQPVQG